MNSTINPEISKTFEQVIDSSFKVKSLDLNSDVDLLLDTINKIKSFINQRNEIIEVINLSLERLTWVNEEYNENTLRKVNAIIVLCQNMYDSFFRENERLVKMKAKKLYPEALQSFQENVESLKESIDDIEFIFFKLRNDPQFLDLDSQISDLK